MIKDDILPLVRETITRAGLDDHVKVSYISVYLLQHGFIIIQITRFYVKPISVNHITVSELFL